MTSPVLPIDAPVASVPSDAIGAASAPEGTTANREEGGGVLTRQRRLYQLVAFLVGVLEVHFSLDNALAEDAFSFSDDPTDFVFASSAVMESVGLAVMFVLAVTGGAAELGGGCLEGFGEPLVVLASGVRQKEASLTSVGHVGAVCQATVIVVFGLILLFHVDGMAFAVVLIVGLIVACVCVLGSVVCAEGIRDSVNRECLAAGGAQYVVVLVPVAIDATEVALLLVAGKSWRGLILAVLDIVVTCLFVGPWSCRNAVASVPNALMNCLGCVCLIISLTSPSLYD